MIIGITGSIGSGKSTVARIFEKNGFELIDADQIGHKLLEKFTEQYKQIVENFGNEILDQNGNINRKLLGDISFSKFKKYRKLNSIMLPPIINEIKNRIKKLKKENKNAALDAPLLLETKAKELVDKIVVVKASDENVFRRNRNFPKEKIIKIKKMQMPIASKLKYADYVINNDGNANSLENQVLNIIRQSKQ